MVHRRPLLAAFVAVFLGAPVAVAEEADGPPVALAPTRFTDHHLSLSGVVGYGTPVGIAGGVVEYSLFDPLAVGAGLGTGIAGLEGAAIVKLRPLHLDRPGAAHAVSVTTSWSVGNWDSTDFTALPDMGHESDEQRALEHQYETSNFAQWLELDAGYELRTKGGFSFRVAWGAAWLVSPGGFRCRDQNGTEIPCSGAQRDRTSTPFKTSIPTFALSFGYAFGG